MWTAVRAPANFRFHPTPGKCSFELVRLRPVAAHPAPLPSAILKKPRRALSVCSPVWEEFIESGDCVSAQRMIEDTVVPKRKSHRGAAKRFKLTASGKVKRSHSLKNHILTKKTTKRKRHLRKSALVSPAMEKAVRAMISV